MDITVDILEGAKLVNGADGTLTLTRVVIVDGVEGNGDEKLWKALLIQGVPQRGEVHPTIPLLRCSTREATPLDTSKVQIVCTYEIWNSKIQTADENQKCQIEVGGTVQEESTNFDKDGNLMEVTHRYVDLDNKPILIDDGTGNQIAKVGKAPAEVNKQIPMMVKKFSRKEIGDPSLKAQDFLGSVNSTPVFNATARKWLCTRLDGISDDGGETYNVNYEFQLNLSTWDVTIVFIDPDTNQPPIGLIEGEGIKVFKVYREMDFNILRVF